MIKDNDLRVGNLLDRNGLMEVRRVVGEGKHFYAQIRIYDHYNSHYIKSNFSLNKDSGFKGIYLDEKTLECCGLRKIDNKFWIGIPKINAEIHIEKYKSAFIVELKGSRSDLILETKFVHELQNMFHALSGEELNINIEKLRLIKFSYEKYTLAFKK